MGERHQIFVVAKIRGRYRTLAAVHRQSLTTAEPWTRCLRVMRIFEAEPNRVPTKQELRAAANQDESFWDVGEIQPFPFILTCLLVGSSFEPEIGYQRRVHTLPFGTKPTENDHDNGITIIDISDPDKIQYCFAFVDHWPIKPRSAFGYLIRNQRRRDEEEEEEEEEDGDATNQSEADASSPRGQLQGYTLITNRVLRNWLNLTVGVEDTSDHEHEQVQSVGNKQSLREQAIEQLVDLVLKDPDYDSNAITEALLLYDFAIRLRKRILLLGEANELPSSPSLIRCLEVAFVGETYVDFSALTQIAPSLIVEAASSVLKSGNVRSLDLSLLHQLSEQDLGLIMSNSESGLVTLYILDMPQISLACVASVWSQIPDLKEIYHTELFGRPLTGSTPHSDLIAEIDSPIVLDTSNPIKTILFARVISVSYSNVPNLRKADGIAVDWQRAKPSLSRMDKVDHMFFSVFPINDILLSPAKLVHGLVTFLRCATTDHESCWITQADLSGFTLAKSFALATSFLGNDSTTIMPLPNQVFKTSSVIAGTQTTIWPTSFPHFTPGDMALVIINEEDLYSRVKSSSASNFRLAVVTPKSTDKRDGYRTQTLQEYLQSMAGTSEMKNHEILEVIQFWEERMSFLGCCKAEEIDELLPIAEQNFGLVSNE
ncbi:MAG: hypothetical protein Q9168_004118 [Polycauliona sp. 1 TL-2023]